MRLLSRLPALAAASLVAALVAVPAQADTPAPAHVPVWDKGPGGERYVAFGDSFVSGPGIGPQRTDVGCARSEKNFPTLVAQTLAVRAFTDASCSAATTVHFTEPQASGGYTNAPQLDALGPDTSLVTFGTMGGNDIGLVGLAAACAFGDCVPAPGTDPLAAKFAAAEERLVDALEETAVRAPDAEVLVVGYGTYLPPGGCPTTLPVTSAEADYLQGQIDRLSDLLERIATDAGVPFVDQRDIPGAAERTVCAEPRRQWLRALETYDDGILFHPSACGMDATAQQVVRVLQESRGHAVTPFDGSCVSAGPAPAPQPEPQPEPQPTPAPTKAERLAALKAKAKTVRVATSCQQQGRQLRVRVTGGRGAVSRAVLRVGGTRVAGDARAPYVLKAKAAKVRRLKGKVRVAVTLRDREVSYVRTLTVKRPRCSR